MKSNQILSICLSVVLVLLTRVSYSQDTKAVSINSVLESKEFVFKVQTVSPARGRMITVTTEYTVVVSQDSLIVDLPYFGRAYSAPIGNTEGGYHFISSKFEYSSSLDKKKRWQISIVPKDVSNAENLSFTVFENGRADLAVTSNSRERISYSGEIRAR